MQKGVMRKRRASPPSEYGRQLQAKQDLKREYNLRERQFKNYVKSILGQSHGEADTSELLLQKLETRLDGFVYRAGFASTRSQARQQVGHGHFMVNGKPTRVPSYQISKNETVSVNPSSLGKTMFKNIQLSLQKFQPPAWITLDKEKMEGKIAEFPRLEEVNAGVDISLVFEFYSR